MFSTVDESLEAMLRAVVPLSAVDIDVSFEAPNSEWSAKLTRPTVNLFLWDVRRSSKRAVAGIERYEHAGRMMERFAPPWLELQYTASVWTSDPGDERALLGAILIALLANRSISSSYLHASLLEFDEPVVEVSDTEGGEPFRLEDGLKLVLPIRVILEVDVGAGAELAKPVSGIDIGAASTTTGARDPYLRRIAGEVTDPAAIGATVLSPRGSATVNDSGRFVIRAKAGDEIIIDGPTRYTVVAPEEGGVRVEAT